MNPLEPAAALSEDDRDLMARLAATAERRNRPAHLCVIAGAVMVIAFVALVFGVMKYRGASERARRERANLVTLQEIGAEIDALKARENQQTDPLAPLTGLQTKLETFAVELGLAKPGLPRETRDRSTIPKTQRVKLAYQVHHATPGPVFSWMERAVRETPGLEIFELKVSPRTNDWQFDVTFARWESTP
ncbi:MAG: hypothetical protein IT439_12725 [Phycisphaerales bacterium]|nr:hypothetical protein [Phycisphaerales bacterium]